LDSVVTVPTDDLAVYTAPDAHMHLARDAASMLISQGARALVLAGSAFVGQAVALRRELGVPAFDAGDPAIATALSLAT
jgi:Asp/Glu/hydantoin racemase